MALLTAQQARITGTILTFVAASAGGDTLLADGRGVLHVRNNGGAAITVTVATPGLTRYGQPDPDIAVVIAAANSAAIGPFNTELNGPSGVVDITYSAVTSVTVALLAY